MVCQDGQRRLIHETGVATFEGFDAAENHRLDVGYSVVGINLEFW
jgi:hypothetical protein